MRSDSIGSAHEPLLPLQRWIQYTQAELRQVRAELQHRYDEEQAIRRIQQPSLTLFKYRFVIMDNNSQKFLNK